MSEQVTVQGKESSRSVTTRRRTGHPNSRPALTVLEIRALSDLDDVTVRIADVAAYLAVLGYWLQIQRLAVAEADSNKPEGLQISVGGPLAWDAGGSLSLSMFPIRYAKVACDFSVRIVLIVRKLHRNAAAPKSSFCKLLSHRILVGAPGFEPGASCAQGRRATRLRYAPTFGTA
jgi:hypothetical protein